eukprot:CAMPEP_0175670620 /NCGR_PEP_ID=MMETSP0097-20121207/19754_1 /TAXON_ID=311494 /ORGANISM="Alexandrium monilatum, Strain CCMP3105" /LENGTH=369 /DNA_ID=CAMNT_0016977201 /DNA_START=13 /DNA_END=1118 /DNA_ORIENTATION=+
MPAPVQAHGGSAPSSIRDAAVEDEVLHCGYFADVVFKFRNEASSEIEEVYGQRALFALLSPPLRRQLPPPAAGVEGGRCEVWLDGGITARGFREVARYVYRLPPSFNMSALSEVLAAAHAAELRELEAAAFQWGLSALAELSPPSDASSSAPSQQSALFGVSWSGSKLETPVSNDGVDDVLRCLQQFVSHDPRSTEVDAWLKALLRAYGANQILASPAFFWLSPPALDLLLRQEAMCSDPASLWTSLIQWGYARAPPVSSSTPPQACETASPTLFGRGARFAEALAPSLPPKELVAWQRQLLPFLGSIRFSEMAPVEFVRHVESVDPMLPELRQAIYAVRRHGAGAACRLPAVEAALSSEDRQKSPGRV